MSTFAELGLSRPLTAVIEQLNFTAPTPIQEQAIPWVIAGRDVVGAAQTGSGKTAAYGLPILECLLEPEKQPRALIITPTRELAVQVQEEIAKFGQLLKLRSVAIYGGTSFETQKRQLKAGMDIVIATPGRLLDHMEQRTISLDAIEILVLDEADRLLDMGFMPQVSRIIRKLSPERQTLLFSATIDERVKDVAARYLNNPMSVSINSDQVEPTEIEQLIFRVHEFDKDDLLIKLINDHNMSSAVVFTKTRMRADWVHQRLKDANISCEPIHGDISQSSREKTLDRFRKGRINILIATDVAARGLDVPTISHVINYDLPQSPEDYVHRIGRTGRAGRSGVAMSFVDVDQAYLLRDIERLIGRELEPRQQVKKKLPPRRFVSRSNAMAMRQA